MGSGQQDTAPANKIEMFDHFLFKPGSRWDNLEHCVQKFSVIMDLSDVAQLFRQSP